MTCVSWEYNITKRFWVLSPQKLGPKAIYFRRLRNSMTNNRVNISDKEHDRNNRETALISCFCYYCYRCRHCNFSHVMSYGNIRILLVDLVRRITGRNKKQISSNISFKQCTDINKRQDMRNGHAAYSERSNFTLEKACGPKYLFTNHQIRPTQKTQTPSNIICTFTQRVRIYQSVNDVHHF